jgi:hypothetical protein
MERGVCRLGGVRPGKNTVGLDASGVVQRDDLREPWRAREAPGRPQGENTERQGGILGAKKCGRGYLGHVMSTGGA